MDDTQQTTQPTMSSQPTAPTMGDIAGMPSAAPTMPAGMVPGGDLGPTAGMTPPPAPEPSTPSNPMPSAPVEPVMPAAPVMPDPAPMSTPEPMAAMPSMGSTDAPAKESTAPAENADDYSYAEDILGEILDSLDRIEAKLEALEKKQG